MTATIIILLCLLVLIAYIFDLTSSKTKIPSVILLLLLGWGLRQLSTQFSIQVPDLTNALPVLGTIGLILIVLEGSLELELKKSKIPVIRKSLFVALVPMLVLSFILGFVFSYLTGAGFKTSLVNMIPVSIISSAIAIPSSRLLKREQQEFIIYESSLSDILGVLFFNFMILNTSFGLSSLGVFILQLALIAIISFGATIGLAVLLHKIDHHIKFIPIIAIVILIYAISKVYHLPGLVFIMLFGLFLGNLDELKQYRWIARLKPDELDSEVHKFKDLLVELAFLIRIFFFLLFGFLINTDELLNTETMIWAFGIVITIFGLRAAALKVLKMPYTPLLYIAPRGLITILLFLSVPVSESLPLVSKSLIIQIIVLTSLVMMYGMMRKKREIVEKKPEAISGFSTDDYQSENLL